MLLSPQGRSDNERGLLAGVLHLRAVAAPYDREAEGFTAKSPRDRILDAWQAGVG